MPKLSTLSAKKKLKMKDQGCSLGAAQLLDKANDDGFPFHHRLGQIKKLLPYFSQQKLYSKEILCFALV